MISLKNIKEYKRKYTENKKRTLALSGISIWFDWIVLLGLSFIVFVSISIFVINLHYNTEAAVNNTDINQQVIVRKINEKEIKDVLAKMALNRSFSISASNDSATSTEETID